MIARGPGRPPDLADEQGAAAALDPRGSRLRLYRPANARSSGWKRRSTPSTGWRSTKATSTTGTTRRRSGPCPPPYVSTVDSGNLLGCLVTLKQGLREKRREVYPDPSVLEGMTDTLAVLAVDVKTYRPAKAGEEYKAFDDCVRRIQAEPVRDSRETRLAGKSSCWHFELHGERAARSRSRIEGGWPERPRTMESYARRFLSLASERWQEFEAIVPG